MTGRPKQKPVDKTKRTNKNVFRLHHPEIWTVRYIFRTHCIMHAVCLRSHKNRMLFAVIVTQLRLRIPKFEEPWAVYNELSFWPFLIEWAFDILQKAHLGKAHLPLSFVKAYITKPFLPLDFIRVWAVVSHWLVGSRCWQLAHPADNAGGAQPWPTDEARKER